MQQDLLSFVPMPRPTLEQPWLRNMSNLNTNAVFLHGSRELQAIATRRMNLQGWTSMHPGLGKQAKSNWSCQSTCRSGESSGALTLSIKSLCVNVWQWWNHGPSNAPSISSAGIMTGFGFDPRQCNYWNQKRKSIISPSVVHLLCPFRSVGDCVFFL